MSNLDYIKHSIKKLCDIEDGARYKVSIRVPMDVGFIERMKFIVESSNSRSAFQLKHIKNEYGFVFFEGEVDLQTKAIYHYYFSFEANHNFIYYKKEKITDHQTITPEEKWKISVNFEVPEWAKGGVMYQIFPDRFCRGSKTPLKEMPRRVIHKSWDEDVMVGPDKDGLWCNDFYGGDIKGIIEKLDYIKSLGVTILYINPLVWSQSNHRYDTSDYEKVDPYAGTNNDLKELCDKAHKLGIKVVLDAVFNHTGNDSKYFNEFGTFKELGAYQSKDSKYFPFFKKYYANNQVYFGYWWGMPNLPVCDGYNREWQQYIYGEHGIIDHWFSLGIDGLRLDVADELTDEFIEGIRRAVKRNKEDGFILGEVWKNPMRMGRGYIESGKGMDTVMNYELVDALIRYFKYNDVGKLAEIIRQLRTEYPKDTLNSLMNFTSTHDISRAINIFSSYDFNGYSEWAWNLGCEDRYWQNNYKLTKEQYEWGKQVYKAYVYFLTFFPGTLSIFYGDEIGLEGMGNLSNRRPFPWNSNKKDYDLLMFFKYIGSIREKEKFLREAELNIFDINDRYVMFERVSEEEKALIAVNRTNDNQRLYLPGEYEKVNGIYRLNNSRSNELNPYGGIVLKKK